LINKNAIIAQYKNANALQIKAAYDYELTIINAYSEVSNQLANIENLEKSYQLKSTQVEALTQSIDIANQLFQSARADYLEVLLTQREALEAKKELIETKNKQITAMVNLYRALGGGWH
jgi:outer membrane protein TolC